MECLCVLKSSVSQRVFPQDSNFTFFHSDVFISKAILLFRYFTKPMCRTKNEEQCFANDSSNIIPIISIMNNNRICLGFKNKKRRQKIQDLIMVRCESIHPPWCFSCFVALQTGIKIINQGFNKDTKDNIEH